MLGRAFQDSDTVANAPPVIILGNDLWRRRFNGDPNIIGKTIRISRRETPPTIIGVMPPGVRFLPAPAVAQEPNYNVNAQVDFWTPAAPNPNRLKQPMWNVVGRLQNGATLDSAQAELGRHRCEASASRPRLRRYHAQMQSLTAEMNRDGRRILLPLLGAAALVLLIACGNVAALLAGARTRAAAGIRGALRPRRRTLSAFPAGLR